MESKYNPHAIEREAQAYWETNGSFRASAATDRPKYYCLSMFPYPSGKLHMGHVRNYSIGDALARYYRMRGYNVLQPMGWDAFGLPAENAAMANNVPPAKWTYDNIAYMKRQLMALGFAIDWTRELATCKPEYYKWNQWLFLRMLEKGIAYKKTGTVNWDPVDRTVLANEQVIDGRGWRTGAIVEKREIPMYYLAITQYAEQLLADLDKLPGWPERVKTMQANWIGKSFGVRFAFPYALDGRQEKLWVFTTRADTIMGVTFCAVAAEHPLAARAARDNPKLAAFVEACKRGSVMEADLATMEKKGMPTGIFAAHPLTGEKVEVWVGNYVLMGYGEGAVMAVPAHDERDFHFAKKYGLRIKPVIAPRRAFRATMGIADDAKPVPPHELDQKPIMVDPSWFDEDKWRAEYAEPGFAYGAKPPFEELNGLSSSQAVDFVAKQLKQFDRGEKQVQWRLRDWGISRQRYWGCPIPIIHCASCGDVPVPDDQLPVVLPEDCVPDGSGNPLAKRADFVNCACPQCGKDARRETDTMDTFVDSSWYYARYACTDNMQAMVDSRTAYWLPVDQYIGGIEHAILHLLYSRFWTKVMRDVGLVEYDEPFANLLTQGMVLNHIFFRKGEKGGINYYAPEEIELHRDANGRIERVTAKAGAQPVEYGGVGTMSKSKRNGVDPQSLVDEYGADTARFFMMFASPPEQTLEWSDSGVEGASRFLKKLWRFAAELHGTGPAPALAGLELPAALAAARREIHATLKKANRDFAVHQFNTVASAAMIMLNALEGAAQAEPADVRRAVQREGLGILLRLLAPLTPHICHELWRALGYGADILKAPWPEIDESALIADEVELVLQVNGKLRGNMLVARNADKAAIERLAVENPNVQKFVGGQTIKKVVVVPGRLVNVVV